ncbi:MAG TPA: hypothetical protein P5296_15600 [Anaerohalosphaeraceae bacterium]|nr:hypothetical protein [Anaerohalosphaeraceae bacterium]
MEIKKTDERKDFLHMIGQSIAEHMGPFFGSVRFNMQNGKYVNCNIEESLKPEKQEKGTK